MQYAIANVFGEKNMWSLLMSNLSFFVGNLFHVQSMCCNSSILHFFDMTFKRIVDHVILRLSIVIVYRSHCYHHDDKHAKGAIL